MEADWFRLLGVIVIGAAAMALLARLARLPPIVSYLLAGLLIGPGLGLAQRNTTLELLAEAGVILLLFLVGLELNLEKLRTVGPVAVAAGLGQVVFTAAGGMVLCLALGFGWMEALVLAVALTFSSTVVVVKILTDKNELDTLYGRIAVGIFLVQDVVVILVLTVLTGMGSGGGGWELALGIGRAFAAMGLLLALVLGSARFLLPAPLGWLASSPAALFVASLAWCLAVVKAADALGLSVELGAFFAGLSIAQLPHSRDLQYRIKPLMNVFVAVFFVTLGLGMAPGAAGAEWLPIAMLSLFVLVGNPLIFYAIIARMGYSPRTAFLSGVTVAQISEFSFIFVAMSVAAGLAGDRVVAITAMVGIITIAASAYLILYNGQLFDLAVRLGWLKDRPSAREGSETPPPALEGHVIVVGMNSLGRKIVAALAAGGETVLAVDTDARKLQGLGCRTLLGSTEYQDVLLDAGLPRARLLVSALQIEEANELLAYRCRCLGIPCCIHAIDLSVVDNLLELDVAYLMLSKVDGVKLQNQHLETMGTLPS